MSARCHVAELPCCRGSACRQAVPYCRLHAGAEQPHDQFKNRQLLAAFASHPHLPPAGPSHLHLPPGLPSSTPQRLAKARRVAAREAAARERAERAERDEVVAVVDSMLESVGAADAFEAAAAAEGARDGSGSRGSMDAGSGSGGSGNSSPRGRPRRHISLEYESEGPASPPLAAGAPQQRRGGGPPAAGRGAPGGKSSGGKSSAGAGGSSQESQGSEAGEEPSPQELLSLEWLRDAPDDVARNYLMSIDGGWVVVGRLCMQCGRGCGAA